MKGRLFLRGGAILLGVMLWSGGGLAAPGTDSGRAAGAGPGKDPSAYAVKINNQEIFSIRERLHSFSAAERAAAISSRILKLAQYPGLRVEEIRVRQGDGAVDIVAGDEVIMTVLEADARAAGQGRQELAESHAAGIRQAITVHRQEWGSRNLMTALIYTLVATMLFVAALIVVARLARRINRAIGATTKIPACKISSYEFFTADHIKALLQWLVKMGRFLLMLVCLYVYFQIGLSFFPMTRSFSLRLFQYVWGALASLGASIWVHLPGLLFIVVLLFITRYILQSLKFFFTEVGKGVIPLPGFDLDWAQPTYKIVRFLIIAFVVVIAYPYIPGSESPAFKGVSIFLGVLFSLGSTSAIANVVAGVMLTYMRAFKVGDVVKIADTLGIVVESTLLVARLRTPKNVEVTIPNSTILSYHITNYSFEAKEGKGLVLHTCVTIGYSVPWRQVHDLLISAARATAHILEMPSPFVLQTALNDFYVTYELNAFTDAPGEMPRIYSELHQNIQDRFNEAGVEIMSPHYTQLRDGNETTIPEQYRPVDYLSPSLKVTANGTLHVSPPE